MKLVSKPNTTKQQEITLNNFKQRNNLQVHFQTQSNETIQSKFINETFNYHVSHSDVSKSKTKYSLSPNMQTTTNPIKPASHLYFEREIERVLNNENRNLKEHNQFLIKEIQSLYEREARIKRKYKKSSNMVLELEQINSKLKEQIQHIVNIVMEEIQRIQILLMKKSDTVGTNKGLHFCSDSFNSNNQNRFTNKNKDGLDRYLSMQDQEKQYKDSDNNHQLFKEIQQKYIPNMSSSFYAYSELSDLVSSPKAKENQLFISNKLVQMKEKISSFINNSDKKQYKRENEKLIIDRKSVHQEVKDRQHRDSRASSRRNSKLEGKVQNLGIPSSRVQMSSTNTNSQLFENPIESIRSQKQQHIKQPKK